MSAFEQCPQCGTVVADLDAHRGEAHDWALTSECAYCGAEFEPRSRDQTYCSTSCSARARQRGGQYE